MILSEPRLLILIYYFSDSKEKMSDAFLVFPPPPGGQVAGQDGCQLHDAPRAVESARVSPVLVVQGWQGAGSVTDPVDLAGSQELEVQEETGKDPQDSQASPALWWTECQWLTFLEL